MRPFVALANINNQLHQIKEINCKHTVTAKNKELLPNEQLQEVERDILRGNALSKQPLAGVARGLLDLLHGGLERSEAHAVVHDGAHQHVYDSGLAGSVD